MPTATNLALEKLGWLRDTIQTLNRIIDENTKRYQEQRTALERANLLAQHVRINSISETTSSSAQLDTRKPLREAIADLTFIDGSHYPHQIRALQEVAKLDKQQNTARMVMATGTGKTRVQCELARIMYHNIKPGTPIIIVTPQKSLVNQFYNDLCRFSSTRTATKDLALPQSAIMKISSGKGAIAVERLLNNKTIHRQRSVLIFCEKSFQQYLPRLQGKKGLALLDEYHAYMPTVEK